MEDGLGSGVRLELHIGTLGSRSRQHDGTELLQLALEDIGLCQQTLSHERRFCFAVWHRGACSCTLSGILLGSLHHKSLGREPFCPYLAHTVGHISHVARNEQGVGWQEGEEGLQGGTLAAARVGDDAYAFHLLEAQLVLHIEGAYAVNLITEEVNAEGVLTGVGINVEQTASQGELPRLIDIIHAGETQPEQGLLHLHHV